MCQLCESYVKTLKDPEFFAEVKKPRYHLEPVSWEEMHSLANRATS
jgi:hypothetical protein